MSGDTSGGKHEQGLSLDAEEFSSVFFRLYLFKGVPRDFVSLPPPLTLPYPSRVPGDQPTEVRTFGGRGPLGITWPGLLMTSSRHVSSGRRRCILRAMRTSRSFIRRCSQP